MEHYRAVYALLRTALWGKERFPLELDETVDWEAVHKELKAHACAALVTDVLGEAKGLDPQLKSTWMMHTMRNIQKWNKLMKAQQELCGLFRQAGIPFVILKGFAAAMYYPQPEYRAMGDVDLIVAPEDFDRAQALMVDNGYELELGDYGRHHGLIKDGIEYELHRYYACMADPAAEKALDDCIYAGIPEAQTVSIGKYSAPVLEPFANGLVLLEHINHHMEAGLGLRQIIDWMLFVDRVLDDRAWENGFGEWTEKIGLKTMAVTVTRMCQLYLGMREEGISWCHGADEDLCRDVMELTMEQGNFGQKMRKSLQTVSILNAMRKVSQIPAMLQSYGCYNWQALKKYPFLKPFAWIYQICRYIKKGMGREHPIRELLTDIRKSGHQDDIMTRLGVTRRLGNSTDIRK